MAHSQGAAATGSIGGQFSAVDHGVQEQRAWLLRVLDWQNALPGMQPAKRQIRGALALTTGMTVLEVGCGTGDDARDMARQVAPSGHIVGIDVSAFIVEEAQRRAAGTDLPVTFTLGDVDHPDCADDSFDRCRAERVLQHVADPARTISEMARVTRHGGRVVVADADWAKIMASDPITQALFEFNARSLRNATIGRDLGQLFRASGLQQISVRFCPVVVGSEEYYRRDGGVPAAGCHGRPCGGSGFGGGRGGVAEKLRAGWTGRDRVLGLALCRRRRHEGVAPTRGRRAQTPQEGQILRSRPLSVRDAGNA
jgi:ubiquinone/menaquinone biosynthesis C-methylase UbiE